MEPGLVSRTIVEQTDDVVILHEVWDLTAPGCPFVRMRHDDIPWTSARWSRQLIFTPEEYEHRKPEIKAVEAEEVTPFAPSWQDDPDMLDVISGLELGTHKIMVLPDPSAWEKRFAPDCIHSCVEWRGRMYVIWREADQRGPTA